MDLRFVSRDLRRLDLAATEVLLAPLAEDDRPPHGVAGLVDWRLAGRVSQLYKGFTRRQGPRAIRQKKDTS